jgi:DNA-binding transcriptional regulator YiaG
MTKLVYMFAPGDPPRLLHEKSAPAEFEALLAHIRRVRAPSVPLRRELMSAEAVRAFLADHGLSEEYAAGTVFQCSRTTLSRWKTLGIRGERNVAAVRYKERWLALLAAGELPGFDLPAAAQPLSPLQQQARQARQRQYQTLVTPGELRHFMERHGLVHAAAATRLGVGSATLSLWLRQGVRRQGHADRVRAIIGQNSS